jgi:hypothetical protein
MSSEAAIGIAKYARTALFGLSDVVDDVTDGTRRTPTDLPHPSGSHDGFISPLRVGQEDMILMMHCSHRHLCRICRSPESDAQVCDNRRHETILSVP